MPRNTHPAARKDPGGAARRPVRRDSGFALLVILLMGAILAITLYTEIPRVAFETQRQKEQLLIDRGEQYKRAIQLFQRANRRWPTKIEDLENTNNLRFLRKRYIDPMTGQDEWRPIHVQNGILTDSKVQTQQKQDGDKEKSGPLSSYLGEVAGLGQQPSTGQPGASTNPGLRRSATDATAPVGMPGMPGQGDPNAQQTASGLQPVVYPGAMLPNGQPMQGVIGQPGVTGQPGMIGQPGAIQGQPGTMQGQPGTMQGQAGMPPGVPTVPGQIPAPVGFGPNGQPMPGGVYPPGQIVPGRAGIPTIPGSTPPNAQNPNQAAGNAGSSYLGGGGSYLGGGGTYVGVQPVPQQGVQIPGQQQQFGQQAGAFPPGVPVNSQAGGVSPAYSTAPGANGQPPQFGQPGVGVNPQAASAAANMINSILTQPRPGGMPTANTNGMQVMGGGIAGFASTKDQDSIMVYQDQSNYSLWEFIFNPNKQKLPLNLLGSQSIGQPIAPPSQPGFGAPGVPINPAQPATPGAPPAQPAK